MKRLISSGIGALLVALTACGTPAAPVEQTNTPARNATATASEPPAPTVEPSPATTTTPSGKEGGNARMSNEMIKDRLSAANARFGFNLLGAILQQDGGKNVFISPASVAIALAMVYNGASGSTQQAMEKALELQGMSLQDVNEAYAALRDELQTADPQVQLSIANSLWARQGVKFNPDFLQRNKLYFGAQVSEMDFNDPATVKAINDWVSQSTNGRIGKIVDRIDPATVMFLINAIYFRGAWTREFDKAKTQDLPFHLLDGSQKQVPLMSQFGKVSYYKGDGFQAVELPYGAGKTSMYVFLPDANSSVAAFEKNLTAANWDTWMSQFKQAEGTLKLPRFNLEYETELNGVLTALGMGVALDPNQADFAAMRAGDEQLYITRVKHKTFVEVNEEGTEAAGVTSAEVGTTSMQQNPETFTMTVDRPFFFAIRDNLTGIVLFVGSIVAP